VERFIAYLVLGLAIAIGFPCRPVGGVAAVLVSAFGLEAIQILVPGRHAHLADALKKSRRFEQMLGLGPCLLP
jgi:hypothetical protein